MVRLLIELGIKVGMQVGREFGELLARDDMSPPGRWNFIFTASNQRDANGT
jgi:hypothetical protein